MSSKVTVSFISNQDLLNQNNQNVHGAGRDGGGEEDDEGEQQRIGPTAAVPETETEQLERLFGLIKEGRFGEMTQLLALHPALGKIAHRKSGRTALMEAATHNRIKMALHLIDRCEAASTAHLREQESTLGDTAPHMAARRGHGGMVVWLWKKCGAPQLLQWTNAAGVTVESLCDSRTLLAIKNAIEHRLLTPAVRRGGTGLITSWDAIGRLHDAAKENSTRQIVMVLNEIDHPEGKKELLETRSLEGKNALHYACEHGAVEAADVLLKAGANPEAEEEYGNTPLIIATNFCRGDDPALIRVLVEGGANVNIKSMFGLVPLLIAAENGMLNVVRYYITEAHADIHRRGAFGNTAAHYSVLNRHDHVSLLLHRLGANFDLKNDEGQSPRDLASRQLLAQLDPTAAPQDDDVLTDDRQTDAEQAPHEHAHKVCMDYADDRYFESTILVGNRHLHIPAQELQLHESVGKGNFSEVFRATFRDQQVAVKRLHVSLTGQLRYLDMVKNEIALMAKLDHPNIIKLLGACVIRPHICMVLGWAQHGSLQDILAHHHRHSHTFSHVHDPPSQLSPSQPSSLASQQDVTFSSSSSSSRISTLPTTSSSISPSFPLSQHTMTKIALEVAQGMAFAHELGIYHRDIRASNVLITEDWTAKICDWGLSYYVNRRTGCQAQSPAHYAIGSLRWMAPEVFRCEGVSAKSDVYSYAMFLYEIITGDHPFPSQSPKDAAIAASQGIRPEISEEIERQSSPTLLSIMRRAWVPLPDERPSFTDIVQMLSH